MRNIAYDGKVITANEMINFPVLKKENGINEAGTFHLICKECDSQIFNDYENPENYNEVPTQKMLAQICLKNSLFYIFRRYFEISFYSNLQQIGMPQFYVEKRNEVNNLDLDDFKRSYKKSLKAIDKN